MRVTNKMMSSNFLRDMNRNLRNLNKLNQQLTSGKEISRPSDDPFKVARAMQLHSDIAANKQYNENIKDTTNWLDTTDTALEQLGNTFQRVRELMVSSGNAAYGSDEKRAIKDEINEKINEMAQILNTSFDGKYIFGGTKTSSKPIGVDDDNPDPDVDGNRKLSFIDNEGKPIILPPSPADPEDPNVILMGQLGSKLNVEISQGVTMEYSVNAKEILNFNDKNGKPVDVMELMNSIVTNLDQENSSAVVNENLAAIDEVLSNLNKIRGEVGAKQNRMESAKDQNEQQNFNMTDILSKTEDIDFAEKTMEVATVQAVYVASLQTSARVLQPSLMDFLR